MDQAKRNVQALADRFSAFHQALITFVERCSTDDWTKVTTAEGWPVGITANHVGAVHYPVLGWVQSMVEGKPTPTITMADVDQINLDNITVYANCTPAEVVEFLRSEGDKAIAYLQTISDADLERTAYLKIFDTTMSAGQLFQLVMIDEAEKHLVSLRETVAKTSMTTAQVKAILQRLNDEIMNEGNLDVIAEIFDVKYASRSGPQLEEVEVGHDAVKAMHHFVHTTYADFHVSINALIAEGELAASNWTCVGIYQGEPSATVQPGQKVTWSGTSWFRVRDGKILERWAYSDDLTPIEVQVSQFKSCTDSVIQIGNPVTQKAWRSIFMCDTTNKAIIQQVNQALNARDWDTLRALMRPEFVDGLRASWILAAFPDIETTLDDILVDGDKVVTRWTNCGTHTAPFMGVAPTGRQVSYTGISIDRLETGKIVESWRNSDIVGVLRQIGGFATD